MFCTVQARKNAEALTVTVQHADEGLNQLKLVAMALESIDREVQLEMNFALAALEKAHAEVSSLLTEMSVVKTALDALTQEQQSSREEVVALGQLITALGPRGVQHFIFEELIAQLQVSFTSLSEQKSRTFIQDHTNCFVEELTEGAMRLVINQDMNEEKITKHVEVLTGGQTQLRSLTQLSGGQWRRIRCESAHTHQ
jgi:DNA repair exonuclease SbcCD ATPase subunit